LELDMVTLWIFWTLLNHTLGAFHDAGITLRSPSALQSCGHPTTPLHPRELVPPCSLQRSSWAGTAELCWTPTFRRTAAEPAPPTSVLCVLQCWEWYWVL
jgi:hypothetical protein